MVRTHMLVALALATLAGAARADLIIAGTGTSAGQAVSAQATVTPGNGTIRIDLQNLTAHTYDAGQLLTQFSLDLPGITGETPVAATAAARRVVAADGSYTDTAGPIDLLADKGTWSATLSGITLTINFNPDAAFALLGAPETDGTYGLANASIDGNAGHNPYAAGTVSFTLAAPGVTPALVPGDATFYFGTNFDATVPGIPVGGGPPGGDVPEPASLGLLALGALGLMARRRR